MWVWFGLWGVQGVGYGWDLSERDVGWGRGIWVDWWRGGRGGGERNT